MEYLQLKTLHITCVALSFALFVTRGMWMLRASPLLQSRKVKIARDLVDTALLGSAITMAWQAGLSPLAHGWLGAKIVALLVYIVLGSIALKRGKTLRIRSIALVLALLTFLYMVATAIAHDPMPWHAL